MESQLVDQWIVESQYMKVETFVMLIIHLLLILLCLFKWKAKLLLQNHKRTLDANIFRTVKVHVHSQKEGTFEANPTFSLAM